MLDEMKEFDKITIRVANLLNVKLEDIQGIVESESSIYTVSVVTKDETDIDDEDAIKISYYTYSTVEDAICEIPDEIKFPKKQYLTPEEKTEYYLENKKLITFALKKINKPDGIDFEELEDVGTFGFVKALNTFDKSNGAKFSTYAVKCVLNEVYYYLRKEQKHLKVVDSFDKEVSTDNNGNSLTLGETISAEHSNGEKSIEQNYLLRELKETLLDCISYLPDDEQYLIIYRYGLDNNIIKTQTEIAETLNMSQANISKLEKTCLKKLRTILKRNNYNYNPKDKRLENPGMPILDLLKMDDKDNYLDRDSKENIEVSICTMLNLEITDIVDVQPTNMDHVYLVTFTFNNRVGVLYNNITNKYNFIDIPLNNKDKFIYLVLGIPLKSIFNKDDLIDTKYQINISDKDFEKFIKKLGKNKVYVLSYRYGLFNKQIKLCDEIASDLKITTKEVLQLNKEAMAELKSKFISLNKSI